MGKEKTKKKRKFRWKTYLFLFIVALIAYVLYFTPGARFKIGTFFNGIIQSYSEEKKSAEEKNKEAPISKEICVYMSFKNNVLEIDGIQCIKPNDLENTIKTLQKKYFSYNVIVTYLQKSSDPYVLAKQVEETLKENNFSFALKKMENYGKEK